MQGLIDTDSLKRLVADDEIDTVIAAFPDMYGRLVCKRLVGRFFVDEILKHGMHACDYLLACDMDMDPVPGYAFTSWAKGYGDLDRKSTRLNSSHLVISYAVFCLKKKKKKKKNKFK